MNLPENQGFFSKSNVIAVVVALFVGLIIGSLVLGVYFNRKFDQLKIQLVEQKNGTQKSGSAANPSSATKEQFIGGTIEKIDGSTLTLNSISEKKIYTIKVTNNTKVTKREFSKDTSPKDTGASLLDLKVKGSVAIGTFENLRDKTEFTADDIFIQLFDNPTSQVTPK
ncbi:MAG: hypothetical protein WC831_03470 [Parcubacteria group bacterium]|jgi:hypothetical protein